MKKTILTSTTALCLMGSAALAERVLFIDSYHEGYPWSDGITAGVESVIGGSGHELKIHRMDTKRNGSDEFKQEAANIAKGLIEEYQPDVVIAADDNAQQWLVVPYYLNSDLPFVFAGVNWDASGYGYPASNVTGMIEVTPTSELVEILSSISTGTNIGFLGGDTVSERKEVENVNKLFGLGITPTYVNTQDEWEAAFAKKQGEFDIVLIGNYSNMEFDLDRAAEFVAANTKVPTGGWQESTRRLTLMNFEKVSREQGEWAAGAALEILGGASASSIDIVQNKQGHVVINGKVAEAGGFDIPAEIVDLADLVLE